MQIWVHHQKLRRNENICIFHETKLYLYRINHSNFSPSLLIRQQQAEKGKTDIHMRFGKSNYTGGNGSNHSFLYIISHAVT